MSDDLDATVLTAIPFRSEAAASTRAQSAACRLGDPVQHDDVDGPRCVTLELVQALPALRSILDDHVADVDEMLPFVVWAGFRGALVRFVQAGDDEAVDIFLGQVDALAGSADENVRNLIATVFLEDGLLLSGGREQAAFRTLSRKFGPATNELLVQTSDHYARLLGGPREPDST